jgi:hypothetical protein
MTPRHFGGGAARRDWLECLSAALLSVRSKTPAPIHRMMRGEGRRGHSAAVAWGDNPAACHSASRFRLRGKRRITPRVKIDRAALDVIRRR